MFEALSLRDSLTVATAIMAVLAGIALVVAVIHGARYKTAYEAASAAATELRAQLADERDRLARLEVELANCADRVSRLESKQ